MAASRSKAPQPSARPPSRWLYLLPVCLLLTAAWTWRDHVSPGDPKTDSIEASGFPLEPATDENDPRRYIAVEDGFVEDAATGVRLPAVEGLTPAEVFAESPYRPDDVAGGAWPGSANPNAGQSPTRTIRPAIDDLRYGIGPRPAGVNVDAIGVKTWVVAIGVDANKALRVPNRADIIGWWSGGSVPGEVGPTVLVGHYDSKTRPGVFSKLKDLEEGELVVVSQTDGSKYTYFVTKVERLKKAAFPTKRVYGWTPESTLRLVTCGGDFDRKTGHYVENTIAYAELLSFTPSPWPTTTFAFPSFISETSSTSIATTTSISSIQTPGPSGRPTQPVAGVPVPSGSTTVVAAPSSASPSSVVTVPTSSTSVSTVPVPSTSVPLPPESTTTSVQSTGAAPSTVPVAPPTSFDPTIPEASITLAPPVAG
jgi:Sortase domain